MEDPHDDLETADRKMLEAQQQIEKLGISDQDYEHIETDFQDILQQIAGDKSLQKFRMEYQKLHKTLKSSHDHQKKLIKRCKQINSQIASHAVKVQIALKLSHDDNNSMQQVKQDVQRTWKLVQTTKEKEEVMKKKLSDLKIQLTELTRRIDTDDTAPLQQQHLLDSLKKEKDRILEIKEEKIVFLQDLRNTNQTLIKKKNGLEDFKRTLEIDVEELKQGIKKAARDAELQEQRMKQLDKKLMKTKLQLEESQEEIKKKQEQKAVYKAELESIQSEIDQLREERLKLSQEIKTAESRNEKLKKENKQSDQINQNKSNQAKTKKQDCNRAQEVLNKKQGENQIATKKILVMQSKIKKILQEKTNLEYGKDHTKDTLQNMLTDNTNQRRRNDKDKKKIQKIMREISKMNKICIDFENKSRYQGDELIMKSNELRKITNQVKASKKEIAKLKALIYQLKRDQDKYSLQASNAYSKYIQTFEQVKIKNSMIAQLQKDNLQAQARLKQQQNLYQAVRSDRAIYAKILIESQQQIDQLKTKYKILIHQIAKLRDQISSKNYMIRQQHQYFTNLQQENAANEQKRKRLQEKKRQKQGYIRNYQNDISKLKYYISEAEQQRMKQKKQYEMVINDRDILGSQLIKRNEQLGSLYQKIKIQQSTLAKGEVSYQQKVIQAAQRKQEIGNLKKEYFAAVQQVSCISDLKKEVYRLQKDLMEAKLKVKALSEELQNPMNVHRYRKLQGTNPETYEMITKIQTLQRRLIAKTEEVAEKEFLIQQKEKLYIELKNILARQPKPAVAEQLGVYQENLKEKTKQMKLMVEELNAAHAKVNQYRFDIDRVSKNIRDMKEEWFNEKRKATKLPIIPEEV